MYEKDDVLMGKAKIALNIITYIYIYFGYKFKFYLS